MSLTPAIAKKHKAMAVLTTTLAAMPAPKNFKLYNSNRQALAAMPSKYHDLWYFRMFFEVERMAAFGSLDMPVNPHTTVKEFVRVFPDSVGWLGALAKQFHANTVVTVLKKLGYHRRGIAVSLATMHLCFIGQLNALSADRARELDTETLRAATRRHMNGHYFGHPARVFVEASKMVMN